MKFFKKANGAVSVFLIIILVPCLLVSSIFVDLGRVEMSKTLSDSAADLALNSLLTKYDKDLNEWYGLVASCQNINEFYETSAEYFLRTLSSQGLSKDEIITVSGYYANATNDDTIYDLLQIECVDDSVKIAAQSNGNLGNPALLKKQVVEFAKYRAPVEIIEGLINRLKNDPSKDAAVESEKTEPLVESKKTHAEAESEFMLAAYNTYKAIKKYSDSQTDKSVNTEKLQSYQKKINSYRDAYRAIHKVMVSNLYNTSSLKRYYRTTYKLDYYNNNYRYNSEGIYSRKETVDGVTTYYISADQVQKLLNNLNTEIGDFEKTISSYESGVSELVKTLPSDSVNAIQWWVRMNNKVKPAEKGSLHYNVNTAAQYMLRAYSKVLLITNENLVMEGEYPEGYDYEETMKTLTAKVKSLQSRYLTANVTDGSSTYLTAVSNLEKYSAENIGRISSSTSNLVQINGSYVSVETAIATLNSEITTMRSELKTLSDYLQTAIYGDSADAAAKKNKNDVIVSLDALLTLSQNYDSTLQSWENTANGLDGNIQMVKEDKEEIQKKREQELVKAVNKASVTELKNRLVNIKSLLDTVINSIDSLKYNGTEVKKLTSYSEMKKVSNIDANSIPLYNSKIEEYVGTTFNFTPATGNACTLPQITNSNNTQISPTTKKVATPQLFIALYDEFKNVESKGELDNKQTENENSKKAGDKAEEDAKNKGRNGKTVSKTNVTDTFGTPESGSSLSIGGLAGIIKNLVGGDFSAMRDDLYVTTYIMSMFSYATYENEGKYNLISDDDQDKLTLSSYPSKYESLSGDAGTRNTWLSEDLEDYYNKSLTNKMINSTNNKAYCAEVEYILYGKDANTDNVKKAYSDIYTIRYALNLVSGFQHFWTAGKNNTANAIQGVAAAIAAATSGIIPAPITKVILIAMLTAMETGEDLNRLEAGFPVELYKTKHSDWWISLDRSGDKDSSSYSTSPFERTNPDKGIFYSDYITIFLYLGLSDSGKCDNMYKRMAEVIQMNLGAITENNAYRLKNSRIYFNLTATLRVKPMMITLPIFSGYSNSMNSVVNPQTDKEKDWCTYTIKVTRGYS